MKAEEFRLLQSYTGMTNDALAARMGVKVNSVQRWRRDGCDGAPKALIQMLAANVTQDNDNAGLQRS